MRETLEQVRKIEPEVPLAARRHQLLLQLNELQRRAAQLPTSKVLDEKLEDINLYTCDAIRPYMFSS